MDYETIGSQRWVLDFASRPEAATRKTCSGPARPFEATPYDRILLAKTAMEWLGQDQGGLKLRVLADDFEVVSALERVRLYPTSVTLFVSLSNPFVLISAKNCSVGQSQNAENRVI